MNPPLPENEISTMVMPGSVVPVKSGVLSERIWPSVGDVIVTLGAVESMRKTFVSDPVRPLRVASATTVWVPSAYVEVTVTDQSPLTSAVVTIAVPPSIVTEMVAPGSEVPLTVVGDALIVDPAPGDSIKTKGVVFCGSRKSTIPSRSASSSNQFKLAFESSLMVRIPSPSSSGSR